MDKNIEIYDIEIYPNLFLVVFYNPYMETYKVFEISNRKDDRYKLRAFLKTVTMMVGFNNLGFDYPLIHKFLLLSNPNLKYYGKYIVSELKKLADNIIVKHKNEVIKNPVIPQLDLFLLHHFDNGAKSTSLKDLEFVFRMREIQELPFSPNTILNNDEIEIVIDYCKNKDIVATSKLYEISYNEIALRTKLGNIYNMDMMNWNSVKIGENILLSAIRKKTGKKKLGQTIRKKIVIKDILLPYLNFKSNEFSAIHEWFKNKVITETKGTFSNIPLSEIEPIKKYCNINRYNGRKMIIKKNLLRNLNVVYKGFQYNFGTGGIHGSIKSGVYTSDVEYIILDVDVTSFYPKLSIVNKYYPKHLDYAFCEVYEDIFETRSTYPKGTVENLGLKLALNGAYGKSNSEHSELYDSQYTMTTTINGQLSLCMLAEDIHTVNDVTMIQINTDGLTIKAKRKDVDKIMSICKKWEETTKLTLEYAIYDKMIIKDVNNYIAVYENGKLKRKGLFEYNRELHKNHSMLVVPKALEAYYINNTPIKDFIYNHNDIWDFFKKVKGRKDTNIIYRTSNDISIFETFVNEEDLQKVTRYYVSKEGGIILKLMPPIENKTERREINVESGYFTTVGNKIENSFLDRMKDRLNYDYYINECYKITNVVK